MSSVKYRPEIDGLRAVAILPVVFFHAGYSLWSGGFVGVDIFFVISGFLITSIIVRELNEGTFSLLSFYERRIRRIVPALSVVILTCLLLFSFQMVPSTLEKLAESSLSATMFFANVFFMRQEGYFDAPADTKPLLHTWSLAVEEQFYIIFPLLMMALFVIPSPRRSFIIKWGVALVLLASLAFSVWLTTFTQDAEIKLSFLPNEFLGNTTYSSANFYLFFTRAWELLIGSLLAIYQIHFKKNAILQESMSFAGLSLIFMAVFFLQEGWPFPGYWALLPTIGAALVIAGNQSGLTMSGQCLAFKPLIWIGKISYSLYLWHWLVFTYANYTSSDDLTDLERFGLIILSTFLAGLSYRFIETPVRHKKILRSQKQVYIGCLIMFLVLILTSTGVLQYAKAKQETTDVIQQAFNQSQIQYVRHEECFARPPSELRQKGPCLSGDTSQKTLSLFVWGDSHADALMPLIEKISAENGMKTAIYAHNKCPPLFGAYYQADNECAQTKDIIRQYIEKERPRHILMVSRWTAAIRGPRHIKEAKEADLLRDDTLSSKTPEEAFTVFERNLQKTLEIMTQTGAQIWIMKQPPEQNYTPEAILARTLNGENIDRFEAMRTSAYNAFNKRTENIFSKVKQNNVHFLEPVPFLCTADGVCPYIHNNNFLYRDDDHLSQWGALYIEPVLEPLKEQLSYSIQQQ